MPGSVHVDFAGTPKEALAYVKEKSHLFPKGLSLPKWAVPGSKKGECSEHPMIYARWSTLEEMLRAQKAFEDLGWGLDSQGITRYRSSHGFQGR